MLPIILTLCVCVAVVTCGPSPHAEDIDVLVESLGGKLRISNSILEDAKLDVPDLIRKYNYPVEEHSVTTEDGYILRMHRIPHGRDRNNEPGVSRPVVFLMHGLLSSSADYVLMGPGCAFAYILAEQGFDVWMGNARGNYYSRKHEQLDPDDKSSNVFWRFFWDEIGNIDLPTMIDYALEKSGRSRMHYIGHSQGTTSFFVMASLRPDYNNKIISMHAMAPVAYMEFNENRLINSLSPFSKSIEAIASLLGIGEFLPNNDIKTWAGQTFCMDEVATQAICNNIIFLVAGWSEQHNATMLPVKLGHTPAGAAVRQFAHYAQSIVDKDFRRYDHGWLRNIRKYGNRIPPKYDLGRVTAPIFLHYSDDDIFAHVDDVYRLYNELGGPAELLRVPSDVFSHLDFIWGIRAKDVLYNHIIDFIKDIDG